MKRHTSVALFVLILITMSFPAFAASSNDLSKIIGGDDAEKGEWPSLAALVRANQSDAYKGQFCGGTLISPSWVLTAAHCLEDETVNSVDVVLGRYNLGSDEGERIEVQELVVHPDYDSRTEDNDVALIRLSSPSSQTPSVVIEQDDPDDLTEQGVDCKILGWGATTGMGSYPYRLQEATVPIANQAQVALNYRMAGYDLTDNMLAAGYMEGGIDTCSGDSGGPLFAPNEDGTGWVVAGITSWGVGCAEIGYPGIYTKVSQYSDWISEYVEEDVAYLYFPHVDAGGDWKTEIGLVNKDTGNNATGYFVAYADNGTRLSGAGVYAIDLAPRGRTSFLVSEAFASPSDIGYLVFEYTSGDPVGYCKFYIEDQYRVAIPATAHITEGTLDIPHIDSSQFWWTGLSLVNTTNTEKSLTIYFDTGDSKSITLGALEHRAFTISSLFGDVPQPEIGSARITSANGVIGLELFGSSEQLSGILLTDQTQRYWDMDYPHVASTDGWWTGIVAYNPSTSSDAILYFTAYDANGVQTNYLTRTITPLGKLSITATDLGLSAEAAWLHLHSSNNICGFELFGTESQNRLGGYSVLDMEKTSGVFPKYSKTGEWTGIAFANTSNDQARITLTARDDNGNSVATATVPLGAKAKISAQPGDIFSSDISGATYIEFTADEEIAGFQLNGNNQENMLDALPAQ